MLEEILGCFLSLFSALALDAPHLSRERNDDESPSEQCIHYRWENHCCNGENRMHTSSNQYIPPLQIEYLQLGNELRNKPKYVQSLLESIKSTFTIILAVLPSAIIGIASQPRSQGLRGETVTKTLVKFVLSFQNFGKKIACAVRHNRIAMTVEYGCVSLRMQFFSQNFGTIKRILPGSLSPSHREGPGTEVDRFYVLRTTNSKFMPRIASSKLHSFI